MTVEADIEPLAQQLFLAFHCIHPDQLERWVRVWNGETDSPVRKFWLRCAREAYRLGARPETE